VGFDVEIRRVGEDMVNAVNAADGFLHRAEVQRGVAYVLYFHGHNEPCVFGQRKRARRCVGTDMPLSLRPAGS
jgi:hypothetical protein